MSFRIMNTFWSAGNSKNNPSNATRISAVNCCVNCRTSWVIKINDSVSGNESFAGTKRVPRDWQSQIPWKWLPRNLFSLYAWLLFSSPLTPPPNPSIPPSTPDTKGWFRQPGSQCHSLSSLLTIGWRMHSLTVPAKLHDDYTQFS